MGSFNVRSDSLELLILLFELFNLLLASIQFLLNLVLEEDEIKRETRYTIVSEAFR